jgi:hypothetical protein
MNQDLAAQNGALDIIIIMKYTILSPLLCAVLLLVFQGLDSPQSECVSLESTYGSLQHAAIHEAGHMVAAQTLGFTVQAAKIDQHYKRGVGKYWKGVVHLRLPAKPSSGSPAIAKLGGSIAEFFIDKASQAFHVPSYKKIDIQRLKISKTDQVSEKDLGTKSLKEARQEAYSSLAGNSERLQKVYEHLLEHHSYP